MVAGEDRGALGGDVLLALDPRAEQEAQHRAEHDGLQHPVEQRGPTSTPERRPAPLTRCTLRHYARRGASCEDSATRPDDKRSSPWRSCAGQSPSPTTGPTPVCCSCHGFTGTPQGLREWGQHLADLGYTVRIPRLPGHGTTWQEMNRTRWQDWYAAVDTAFRDLHARCDHVFVGGLSMGGALAPPAGPGPRTPGQRAGPGQPGDQVRGPAAGRAAGDQAPRAARSPGIANDIKKEGVTELGYTAHPAEGRCTPRSSRGARSSATCPRSPSPCCSCARRRTTWCPPRARRWCCPGSPARTSPRSCSRSPTTWPRSTTTRRGSSPRAPTFIERVTR